MQGYRSGRGTTFYCSLKGQHWTAANCSAKEWHTGTGNDLAKAYSLQVIFCKLRSRGCNLGHASYFSPPQALFLHFFLMKTITSRTSVNPSLPSSVSGLWCPPLLSPRSQLRNAFLSLSLLPSVLPWQPARGSPNVAVKKEREGRGGKRKTRKKEVGGDRGGREGESKESPRTNEKHFHPCHP